jgi:hypothetical protein
MFLVERLSSSPSPRADLFPQRLFTGSGDLVRASLMASQAAEPAPSPARRPAAQLDLAFPAARQRKAG